MKLLKIFLALWLLISGAALFAETTYYAPAASTPVDPEAPSDATITSNINKAIQSNQSLSSFDIKAAVQNGIVTLSGTVDTLDQAKQLVDSVALVKGVKDIFTDDIFVRGPAAALGDELMTQKVKGALVREKFFEGVDAISELPIRVESSNGIVYLRGTVNTLEQRVKIIQLIQRMKSVPRVISVLHIKAGTVNVN